MRSISDHRLLVLLVAVFFTVASVAFYLLRPITYAAHAGALLQNPRTVVDSKGNGSKGDTIRYVADQIAVMKSNDVLVRASKRMREIKAMTPMTPGELQKAMTITADQGSSWVTVRVLADDPVTARYAADSEVYAYRITTKDHIAGQTRAALRKLDRSIATVAKRMTNPRRTAAQQASALELIRQLHARRNRIEVDGQLTGDGVAIFSAASNGKRQGATLLASMLIGLVFGGLVGCGLAYLLESRTARRLGRQASASRPPGVGVVPPLHVPPPPPVDEPSAQVSAEQGAASTYRGRWV